MRKDNVENTVEFHGNHKKNAKYDFVQRDTSKDTKEEKSHHLKENIWEKMFQSVSDWIFLTDLDCRIIKTNKAGEKFTGLSCSEITGQTCCKLVHNTNNHIPGCPIEKMTHTSQKASSEILLPDGKWVQVTVEPVRNNENKTESIIHIIREITRQKKTEELLRSNEAQLSNAAKIAQIGYWEYDVDKKLFIFNDQFYSIFRTTIEQVGSYRLSPEHYAEIFIHPDDRSNLANEMEIVRKSSDKYFNRQTEHRILYDDGQIGFASIRYFVIKNNQGRATKIYGVIQDITHNRNIEQEIVNTKNFYGLILNNVQDGIWVTNEKDQLIYINSGMEKIAGVKSDDFLGLNVLQDFPPETTEHFLNFYLKVKNTLKPQEYEAEVVIPAGRKTIQSGWLIPRLKDGKYEGIICTIQDITERKINEESLRQSEEKFRNVVENASEGILVIQDYRKVYFNPRWLEITGFSNEEYQNIEFLSLIHPDDLPFVTKAYEKHSNRESIDSNIEFRLIGKSKEIQYLSAKTSNIQWENKPAILVILEDISYRKKAENALSESEQKYRLMFENMINGLALHEVVFDDNNKPVDYKFLEVNSAFEKLTGLKRDVILNKKVTEVMPGIENDPADWINKYAEVALTGKEIRFEDYSKPLDKWYSVIAYSTRRGRFATIFEDITERKKTQESLQRSEYNLSEAQRIANIGSWALNLDTKQVICSDEMLRIWDQKPEKEYLEYEEIFERIHPEDRSRVRNELEQAIANATRYESEFRIVLSNQETRIIHSIGHIEKDQKGRNSFILGTGQDITELKKAQQEIIENEILLNETQKLAKLGGWEWNFEKNKATWTDEVYEIYGVDKNLDTSDLEKLLSFYQDEDREKLKKALDNCILKHEPYDMEVRFINAQGKHLWCRTLGMPVFENENLIKLRGYLIDITNRKKAEIELKESEEKYRLLVETLNEGIWKIDTKGYTTFVNSKMAQMLGYTVDEMLGKHLFSFMDEKWVNIAKQKLKERSNGIVAQHEFVFQRKNGESVNMLINTSPFYDNKGNYAGALAGVANITGYVKAMEEIKTSQVRYRELFENMSSGVAVYDVIDNGKDFIFKDFNRAGEKYDKQSRKDLIGKSIFEMRPGAEKFGLIKAFRKAIKSNKPIHHPIRMYKDNRLSAWYENYVYTLPSGELVAVFDDVTEKKLAEIALHENEKLLNEVGKIAKIGGWEMDLISHKAKWTKGTYDIVEIDHKKPAPGPDEHLDYYLPEYRPIVESALNNLIEKNIPLDFEAKAKTAKGNIKWFRAIGKATRKNGICTKIYGTLQDITEQKEVELVIQRNLNALKQAEEIALLGIFERNWQTGKGYWSDGFYRLLGLEPQQKEYSHELFMDFIHPDDRQRVNEHIHSMIAQKKSMNIEFRLISADGTMKYIHGIALNVYDVKGKPLKTIGTFQNITENKIAEDILNKHRRLLEQQMYLSKTLLDAIPCIAMLIKPETREIVASNKAATKVGAIPGKTCFETWAQKTEPCSWCRAPKLWKTGSEQHVEVKYMDIVWDAYWIPVSKNLYMHYAFDITQRKKIEASILKYQEQLKSLASQLTLTEEKERYRIATHLHDQIGQYLAVSRIKLAELLDSDISQNTTNTLKLIEEWLFYAIKETRSLTYDLSSPILHELGIEKAIAAWLDDEVRNKYNIKTEFYSDMSPISLDDDIQVLLFRNVRELLFNVIKHANASKVKVSIITKNNNVKIVVQDNGVGFNLSENEDNAAEKAKFGLFSIRERLEQFGGHIEIDTAPGKGCKVTLTAPIEK